MSFSFILAFQISDGHIFYFEIAAHQNSKCVYLKKCVCVRVCVREREGVRVNVSECRNVCASVDRDAAKLSDHKKVGVHFAFKLST